MPQNSTKKYSKLMIASFIFLVIVFSLLSLGAIFITAYGNAWSPWSQSTLETIWTAKGFILTTTLSLIALIGFIQDKKYGILCGLSISFIIILGIIAIFIFGLNGPINNIFLFSSILVLLIGFLVLYGIFQMEGIKNLSIYDYLIICCLTVTTLLCFPSFFYDN